MVEESHIYSRHLLGDMGIYQHKYYRLGRYYLLHILSSLMVCHCPLFSLSDQHLHAKQPERQPAV